MMHITNKIAICSFVGSIVVLSSSYYGFEKVYWSNTGIAIYTGRLLLGVLLGILFCKRNASHQYLGFCCKVHTHFSSRHRQYGFAIIGAPFLLAYGFVVFLDTQIAKEESIYKKLSIHHYEMRN